MLWWKGALHHFIKHWASMCRKSTGNYTYYSMITDQFPLQKPVDLLTTGTVTPQASGSVQQWCNPNRKSEEREDSEIWLCYYAQYLFNAYLYTFHGPWLVGLYVSPFVFSFCHSKCCCLFKGLLMLQLPCPKQQSQQCMMHVQTPLPLVFYVKFHKPAAS